MPVGAAIGGAAVVGAGASIYSGNKAAKAQGKASSSAASNERAMFNQTRLDNRQYYNQGRNDVNSNFVTGIGRLSPYTNPGGTATARLSALAGLNGTTAMTNALSQDPGYQFRMNQGVSALDRSAASRGMLQSGAQQKALMQYGQGLASDELNNAFQRVGTVQGNAQQASVALANMYQNRGTTLGNMAVGRGSQNQQLSMNTSNALGQYAMAGGRAQAQGYENTGSSINGGIQNGLMAYNMYNQNQGGMYGGGTSPGLNGQTINWYNRG